MEAVELPAETRAAVLDAGCVVLFTEGDEPSRPGRALLACAVGARACVPLHTACSPALHVHWYPYVREAAGPCARRLCCRQASLRVPDVRAWAGRTVDVALPDGGPTLRLRVGALPAAWAQLGGSAPTGGADTDTAAAFAAYLARSAAAFAGREFFAAAGDARITRWPGSGVRRQDGLQVPMAAFVHEAVRGRFADAAVVRAWVWHAVRRLGLQRTAPAAASRDVCAELLAEVATTRLRALVYQTDRDLRDRAADDWWFVSESPDVPNAIYDCEDGTFEILATLQALQAVPRKPGEAGWLARLQALAAQYTFALALNALRPSSGVATWHAVVVGVPRATVLDRLHPGEPEAQERPPPVLWIEPTEYTTSHWGLPDAPDAAAAEPALLREPRVRSYVHSKVPASTVRTSPQYLGVFALLLPPAEATRCGAAEVVLSRTGCGAREFGVPVADFVARPEACEWRAVPGWTAPALAAALRRWRQTLAPRPALRLVAPESGSSDSEACTGGGVCLLARALDLPAIRACAAALGAPVCDALHDDPWGRPDGAPLSLARWG